MEKQIINVPKGIRFISDWKEFSLPDNPTIINKTITGCGFTEYCIRNDLNIILCSPRKILLENKESQHKGEVFYVRNEIEPILGVDKDLSSDNKRKKDIKNIKLSDEDLKALSEAHHRLKDDIRVYYINNQIVQKPCKILVTYDSFRHVKEALGKGIENFYIVVDEFQSIFTDSRFKSDTEMEFMGQLKDLSRVSYVSATPMLDNYLNMLDEFKDLPYYELDWIANDPQRVFKPQIEVKSCQSILSVAYKIINSYQLGIFEQCLESDQITGEKIFKESRELVLYVNSVKNICDIIKKCGLTPENTNILCSDTLDNRKKLRQAYKNNGLILDSLFNPIGKVPRCGEPHKMFTLCTRTVYLGADFYSTCARSVILSDANIECLAVDISLDLPQILGRQRLKENPWKNRAELYFKSLSNKNQRSQEEFMEIIQRKLKKSQNLLNIYNSTVDSGSRHDLAEKIMEGMNNYSSDYVSVNRHLGSDLVPEFNNLVMVSELRAFEIQQIDYKDRFSVFSCISSSEISIIPDIVDTSLQTFNSLSNFVSKMKFLCDLSFNGASELDIELIFNQVPLMYKNYYYILGKDRIKSLSYQKSRLDEELQNRKIINIKNDDFLRDIKELYKPLDKVSFSKVKSDLKNLYESHGVKQTAKAKDIEKYYNVQLIKFSKDPKTGKRENGYEILGLKE